MGKRKTKLPKGDPKVSRGGRKCSKTKKLLRRLKMKINRFKRYKQEEKYNAKGSKRKGWNIEGMLKHLSILDSVLKRHCRNKF